jgi:hypothetical protein
MIWVRGTVVRHTVDLYRRAHRERPHSTCPADRVQLALCAGRKVTLQRRGGYECDIVSCEWVTGSGILERTWKRVKPPSEPEPVAATSSGT